MNSPRTKTTRGDRLVAAAAAFLRDAAVVALAFMMLLTTGDIVLRWTVNQPIFGAFELVELSLVALVFLALPYVFDRERHIVVNVLDGFFPAALRRWLDRLAALAALVFIGLIGVYMVRFARDAYRFGDRTMDMGMPVTWFWVPVFVGIAGSLAVCVLRLIRTARRQRDGSEPG